MVSQVIAVLFNLCTNLLHLLYRQAQFLHQQLHAHAVQVGYGNLPGPPPNEPHLTVPGPWCMWPPLLLDRHVLEPYLPHEVRKPGCDVDRTACHLGRLQHQFAPVADDGIFGQSSVLALDGQSDVLHLEIAPGFQAAVGPLKDGLPRLEAAEHVADEDEVELVVKEPLGFYVVDDEATVCRNAIDVSHRMFISWQILLTNKCGCIGLRSTPTT